MSTNNHTKNCAHQIFLNRYVVHECILSCGNSSYLICTHTLYMYQFVNVFLSKLKTCIYINIIHYTYPYNFQVRQLWIWPNHPRCDNFSMSNLSKNFRNMFRDLRDHCSRRVYNNTLYIPKCYSATCNFTTK